jgi:hypothetical protein
MSSFDQIADEYDSTKFENDGNDTQVGEGGEEGGEKETKKKGEGIFI